MRPRVPETYYKSGTISPTPYAFGVCKYSQIFPNFQCTQGARNAQGVCYKQTAWEMAAKGGTASEPYNYDTWPEGDGDNTVSIWRVVSIYVKKQTASSPSTTDPVLKTMGMTGVSWNCSPKYPGGMHYYGLANFSTYDNLYAVYVFQHCESNGAVCFQSGQVYQYFQSVLYGWSDTVRK